MLENLLKIAKLVIENYIQNYNTVGNNDLTLHFFSIYRHNIGNI